MTSGLFATHVLLLKISFSMSELWKCRSWVDVFLT